MSKQITIYRASGTDTLGRPQVLHSTRTRARAETWAAVMSIANPTIEAETRTEVEVGDCVAVELLRGGRYIDSVHVGGEWVRVAGTIVEQVGPESVLFRGDGETQVLSPVCATQGFPVRGLTLIAEG